MSVNRNIPICKADWMIISNSGETYCIPSIPTLLLPKGFLALDPHNWIRVMRYGRFSAREEKQLVKSDYNNQPFLYKVEFISIIGICNITYEQHLRQLHSQLQLERRSIQRRVEKAVHGKAESLSFN